MGYQGAHICFCSREIIVLLYNGFVCNDQGFMMIIASSMSGANIPVLGPIVDGNLLLPIKLPELHTSLVIIEGMYYTRVRTVKRDLGHVAGPMMQSVLTYVSL